MNGMLPSKSNLKSYTTDRRVFEYWTEGNWVAADQLMGKVQTDFNNEICLNGHPGPCSSDHIGPISLGFTHRPEFQLLCKSCNSAKNNRMTLRDVIHLRTVEINGENVISWHSKALWDLCKEHVIDDETARRISKILRDNRHVLMSILKRIADANHFVFLATFLELRYAEKKIEFVNLRIDNSVTKFDKINCSTRDNKYVEEQKIRRCRVAFESLRDYFKKGTRNVYQVDIPEIESKINGVIEILNKNSAKTQELDEQIKNFLVSNDKKHSENSLALLTKIDFDDYPESFIIAKDEVKSIMQLVATELKGQWNSERYVRSEMNSNF
jgi:Type II restriction endonuclease (RE_Alw26IDE)